MLYMWCLLFLKSSHEDLSYKARQRNPMLILGSVIETTVHLESSYADRYAHQ